MRSIKVVVGNKAYFSVFFTPPTASLSAFLFFYFNNQQSSLIIHLFCSPRFYTFCPSSSQELCILTRSEGRVPGTTSKEFLKIMADRVGISSRFFQLTYKLIP